MALTKKKWPLLLAIIGFCLLGGWWINSQSELEMPPMEPMVRLEGVELVGRKDGERQWLIQSMEMRQEGDAFLLDEISQGFLYRDSLPAYSFHALQGVWQRKNNNLELIGKVLVTDKEGFSLAAEKLVWYGNQEMVEIYGDVRIEFRQEGEADETP